MPAIASDAVESQTMRVTLWLVFHCQCNTVALQALTRLAKGVAALYHQLWRRLCCYKIKLLKSKQFQGMDLIFLKCIMGHGLIRHVTCAPSFNADSFWSQLLLQLTEFDF